MTEGEELAAMRRTRDRLAHPPFRPVGDWRASRAAMVAAYDRAIQRAERALAEPGTVNRPGDCGGLLYEGLVTLPGSVSARAVSEAEGGAAGPAGVATSGLPGSGDEPELSVSVTPSASLTVSARAERQEGER